MEISSRDDANRIARMVVDTCYDGFDFRGRQGLEGQAGLRVPGGAGAHLRGFTPEELRTIFKACGFTATIVSDDDNGSEIQASSRYP